ncbi:MAG: TPM domain-containing protein [Bacteroidales bacterium]|nr:TPM domain-containing protein [Bacteroidales bacterium]
MDPSKFFTQEEQVLILRAIKEAETNTSGEIRVHIESKCKEDVLDHAAYFFEKLNMHETKLRNGVLIYLAVDDRKFAILGDVGINQVTSETFWDEIKEEMLILFREQKFTEGLIIGIKMIGEALKVNFPYQNDDVNELSDEISFGKK